MDNGKGRRIAVTGGRAYANMRHVKTVFDRLACNRSDTLIEGGATGADRLCRLEAIRRGMRVETHRADWRHDGRAAGPLRNRRMIATRPDMLIAFPGGKGTRDCVLAARQAGIPVIDAGERS